MIARSQHEQSADTLAGGEIQRLEERVRNLAQEKSNLQLVNDLMGRLSAAPGLETTVLTIIRLIVESLGGSNVAIYYQIGPQLHYADVHGIRYRVTAVGDPLALQALETRRLAVEIREFQETRMTTAEFTKASYWAIPLLVGDRMIGVLKMDGMLLAATEVSGYLQPFFSYAAMVLKNEIESHLKLVETARLAAIVESSDDAIFGKTLDGIITSWNRGAERIYGYTEPEVVGRPVSLLVPTGLDDDIPGILARVRNGEHIDHYETRRRRKDGKIIHVSLTVSPIRDAEGTIVAASSIGRDVTEHKQAEETLRRSAEEMHDLYNRAPCGYHSLDSEGRFLRINDTELLWLGYSRDEVVGKMNLADLVTPDSLRVFQEQFPLFKKRGWVKDLEFEMVRRNGTTLPVLVSATTVRDDHGRYVMSRSTVYDITERKKVEEDVRRLNQELDQRVKERTAELEIKNMELERMNRLFVGRELRMVELKQRIGELERQCQGLEPRSGA